MDRYFINIEKLITSLLAPLKRTANRIAWIKALLVWIDRIHEEFITYGDKILTEAKLNGQTINIEYYLNERFGNGIQIVNSVSDTAVAQIGEGNDADDYIGATSDESDQIGTATDSSSFVVRIPSAVSFDSDELNAILNKYKVPGSTFIIEIT